METTDNKTDKTQTIPETTRHRVIAFLCRRQEPIENETQTIGCYYVDLLAAKEGHPLPVCSWAMIIL